MVESTANTKRDVRGYRTTEIAQPTPIEATAPRKRSPNVFDNSLLAMMDQGLSRSSIDELAALITANVDAGNPDLKQQAALYLKQLTSAYLAVSICNSGFDLPSLCDDSLTPDVRYRLGVAGYNPEQVSNIVCFCSVFGLPLNANNQEVQRQLTDSIYALQTASEPNADISHLCDTVSIPYGPALQIDNSGIKSYVCTNGTSISSSFAIVGPMVTASSGTTVSVGTINSFISEDSGTWANSTSWSLVATGTGAGVSMATGEGGTWINGSSWTQFGTATGTGFSVASGEPGPWANATGNGSGNWSEGTITITGTGQAGETGASWSAGSGTNETGAFGTGTQAGGWSNGATATGGSWDSNGTWVTGTLVGTGIASAETSTITGSAVGWGSNGTGAFGTTGSGTQATVWTAGATATGEVIWVTGESWTLTAGVQSATTGIISGTGGSWTQSGGATGFATAWGWNGVAAAAPSTTWTATVSSTGVATGWGFDGTAAPTPTGGAWTVTGSGTGGATGLGSNETAAATPTETAWTGTAGSTGEGNGWGWNGTAAAAPTGGVWTATDGSTVAASGWGFNASFAGGPGPATGGWGTGVSWTATGGSWGTGVAGTGSNETFTFALGTGSFKTIVGTGSTTDLWSIVIESATTITVQNATGAPFDPTSSLGYPSWTTSTVTEPPLK